MTIEQRLRDAFLTRTSSVEPTPHGLHQIEEMIMDAQRRTTRNRMVGVAAAAAVVAVVVGVTMSANDDDQITVAATTTSTTEAASTTSTTIDSTVDPSVPVFPDASTSRRFDDPQEVAAAFATDMLGFTTLLVSDYMAGDSRSGEVELRGFVGGRPTTVAVRRLADDTWFVMGASVESIRLDVPTSGASLASPHALRGAASAFEGHVVVRLFADGEVDPIGESYVTGRGDGELGEFSGSISFEVPAGATNGVLVLLEPSAKDGSTVAATAIRVHFAP